MPISRLKKDTIVPVLTAKAADGVGSSVDVSDYRHMIAQFASASSANLTVKFQGSVSDAAPNFAAARTATNHWDYIAVYDLQNATIINGDTGIALTGTDDFRNVMINTDGLKWVNCEVSSRVAGNITVNLKLFN